MSILFLDLFEAQGHIKLNNFIVDEVSKFHKVNIYGSKKFLDNFPGGRYEKRALPFHMLNGAIMFRVFCLLTLLYMLLFVRGKGNKLVLLSYDEIIFSMLSRFLSLKFDSVAIFEHATVPSASTPSFKKMMYSRIYRNVKSIVLEDYVASFLEKYTGRKVDIFQHPCLFMFDNKLSKVFGGLDKPIIFCPSREVNDDFHMFMANSSDKYGFFYLGKTTGDDYSGDNFQLKRFYENKQYEASLASCDYIIIPLRYDYRVSGPFYEALATRATIVMQDSLLARNMLDKYGCNKIKIYTSNQELIKIVSSIDVNKNSSFYDVVSHNEISHVQLKRILK